MNSIITLIIGMDAIYPGGDLCGCSSAALLGGEETLDLAARRTKPSISFLRTNSACQVAIIHDDYLEFKVKLLLSVTKGGAPLPAYGTVICRCG